MVQAVRLTCVACIEREVAQRSYRCKTGGFTHFPTFAISLVVLLPLPCSAAHSRSRQLSTFARFIFCLVSELNQLTKLRGASTNMGGEEGKGQSAQELP